ncbi:helix-turn-helix transcriptional regulator [Streptomyces sp. NPDC050804]|uniref:helix-turn-helix domain-containing protein n=1 Tax=unclassified Streptomyces TaxID=2593676 RepID=UPI0034139528|nr:helix-turn-helix transcriptional regulator [Streptomyces sp. NBC_00872]
MCRPEKPLTTSNKALRELQDWLRDQRKRTQQGYRALSVRAGCHATTLQRAASGETVPKLQTVLNYARACDASPEEARRLWRQARYEQTRRARGGRSVPAPRPEFIRDFIDLSAALQDLYEKVGSPALRAMEQRAGKYGFLPRSTAHRIVTKRAMPHSLQQFQAYLRACEVPEADWPGWEAAWTRAWRHEKFDDFAALGTISPDAEQRNWFAVVDPEEIVKKGAETLHTSIESQLQEYYEMELFVPRDGARSRVSFPVRLRDQVQRVRQRGPGPASRHVPGRPVPGQLACVIGEPEPEAPAFS